MSLHVLQRPEWRGESVALGQTFRVRRERGGQQIEAVCSLVTHQFGWELRLEVAGSLQRSQVCRTQDDVLEVSDQWRGALVEKGWR